MREAIDYNALSWIRQEVGVTLKQARLELEEFAESDQRKELLQGCASRLHEARGPLQMVNIKGADMLACEMEEAIADLLLESVSDTETLLEQLMQGFLELPEYLANLRAGKRENPRQLFPLINSLRAVRNLQPLKEEAVFSPDLSAAMPAGEFDRHVSRVAGDIVTLARTARVRFQSGLLEWYRDSGTNQGLQTLVEVLEHLQRSARTEPAARLWWAGAGVAEVLRDGVISATPPVKRLFGQLDRQIKRMMDDGEQVFTDLLSEDLLKNLLFQLAGVATDSPRVNQIRSTFGIASRAMPAPEQDADDTGISEELLQTVSATAREDVDRIKDQLDSLSRDPGSGAEALATLANGLHALGNTLGMIGMEDLGDRLAGDESQLRDWAASGDGSDTMDLAGLANTLVSVEDALSDAAVHPDGRHHAEDHGEAVLRQGQHAVISAVIADISTAKEAINDFLQSSGETSHLDPVPVLLNKICGGLALVGEEQLAATTRQIRGFVVNELLEKRRQLNGDELDSLADAICSIEYCVEELGENHKYGERAISVAAESLEKLGYSVPAVAEAGVDVQSEAELEPDPADMPVQGVGDAREVPVMPVVTDTESVTPRSETAAYEHEPVSTDLPPGGGGATAVAEDFAMPDEAETPVAATAQIEDAVCGTGDSLQVVAPDADGEIVEIFIEEAGEVLDRLAVDIPAWVANPDDRDVLGEIRRGFHTLKGSGRMIGAMATGELAWAYENLLNRIIEGSASSSAAVLELVSQATPVLKDLVAQVGNPDTIILTDTDALRRRAAELGETASYDATAAAVMPAEAEILPVPEPDTGSGEQSEVSGESHVDGPELSAGVPDTVDEMRPAAGSSEDLPVLKADADPEIVEIFLEEAGEELGSLSIRIPEWIQQPEDQALLGDIRRSLHTIKGSGRMAGAMRAGELAWSMETLLNKVIERALAPTGSLFALLAQVPQAVSGLLRQVQDGSDPDVDIDAMMRKAAELATGMPLTAEAVPVDEADTDSTADGTITASGVVTHEAEEDEDAELIALYTAECGEHLGTLAAGAGEAEGPVMVSDAWYRALHTLSGISESASVPGIGRLAAALYRYFGELHQDGRMVPDEALGVLEQCVREMSAQLQRLPNRYYDESAVTSLLERIAALPAGMQPVEAELVQQAHDDEAPEAPECMISGDEGGISIQSVVDETEAFEDIPELPSAALPVREEVAAVQEQAAASDANDMPDVEEATAIVESGDAGPVEVQPDDEDIYAGMDQELYEIFVEEATEIIDSSESVLRGWSESPDDRALMENFQRLLHTLKGGARMVDISAIGDLSHALESLLTRVTEDVVPANDDLFSLLQESHDRLAEMLEKVKSRVVLEPARDLETRLARFDGSVSGAAGTDADISEAAVQPATESPTEWTGAVQAVEIPLHRTAAADDHEEADASEHEGDESGAFHDEDGHMAHAMSAQTPMVERRKDGRARGELVRVQADVLDNLVNNAGEINIYRARMEQQISNFRFNLTELDQTISRLRDQLRQLEMETEAQILFRYEQDADNRNPDFDPLEMDRYSKLQQLSRSLIESISDLRSLEGLMDVTTRDSETLLLQQSRVSTDLQESLIRTRMIPFAGLAPRLRRIVRQAARQLDKKVDLHLRGAEGEMDRAVIERIVAPLEHMLRNSVAHGIESPERRRSAGKRSAGTITIDLSRDGTEIVLRISDDGAGLDIDAIRKRAIERGLMEAGMSLPDSDVMQFVLQSGFSTASEVTQISGRGVGMDVVNSEVKQLGGSLHIDSERGKGSVFTIRLPYTLAINQALLITVGEQVFCVPMSSIEGVVTATTEQLSTCYDEENQEFGYAGHQYQLMHLGSLLGISRMDLENAGSQVPVLLVRAGEKRIGVQVDAIQGSREVVIKPLGAQLSMVDGITGATILGDGRVVMILDMFAVSRMKVREQAAIRAGEAQDDSRLLVMVVDDSITVRKVTTRLLERSGYRVMTAKDGVDAMGQLQEVVPDMMLLDIEMPRMDGFELATHMRNDERLKHVPIIMITSRTGDKHRERAFEIGVNEYLGKPYQESELIASINNIIGINTIAVGG